MLFINLFYQVPDSLFSKLNFALLYFKALVKEAETNMTPVPTKTECAKIWAKGCGEDMHASGPVGPDGRARPHKNVSAKQSMISTALALHVFPNSWNLLSTFAKNAETRTMIGEQLLKCGVR